MPSDTITPAQIVWTGGTVNTSHPRDTVTPFVMRWTAGEVGAASSSELTDVSVPTLDRLAQFDQLLNRDGTPSVRFMTIWQFMCEQIEASFGAQQDQITDLTAIVSRLNNVETQAQAAVDTAAATAATVELTNSWAEGLTLTPATSGTITISAHSRYYSATNFVAVNSGSVSGFAANDLVYIYYDDTARAGGAVSYQATTGLVAQEGARHIVGQAQIPPSGAVAVEGVGAYPPGYFPPELARVYYDY
jgi:hypothetical protein